MAAADTAVTVNFIFANYERKVILTTSLLSSGYELKAQLVENWPEDIPICEDMSRIRMICMGNGFLTDDKILGPKFPIFAHPTPINVSIRPPQAPSKSLKGPASYASSGAQVTTLYGVPPTTSGSMSNGDMVCDNSSHQQGGARSGSRTGPFSRGGGGGCCVVN